MHRMPSKMQQKN